MPWQTVLLETLGKDSVFSDLETRQQYSGDKWYASCVPDVVVLPSNTAEVSQVMQIASRFKIPVTTRGAGVGYVGGCVPVHKGIVLSTERLNKIISISPSDGTAIVQPGVITAELQKQASDVGWFYPPDPASKKECSIGGNIATNAGGPRCLKYGVTRNYVLGLEVVLANGDILKCGGCTHKNKSGFDLSSFFIGSEGMLGIITEATLRLIPHPQSSMALSISFGEFAQAAQAVQSILNAGHLPAALEITDAFTLQAARNYLQSDRLPLEAQGHVIVEIDGRQSGLLEELHEISHLVTSLGAIKIEKAETPEAVEEIWALRREFSYSLKATGMTKLNEDIVIPRSELVALVSFCQSLQAETGLPVACFGHSGDGNIHTNIMVENYDDPQQQALAKSCVNRLFQWVIDHRGSITGEHGIGLAKAPWFPSAIGETAYLLHKRIKQCLDPLNLLNPGKMGLP
jgi:glycolate oxidase